MSTYRVIPNLAGTHPFSLAAAGEEWVFITGVGGHHDDGSIDDDVLDQTRAAVSRVADLLEAAGSSLAEIVYFRPLVAKREYAFEMDGVLREMLPDPKPASGALVICELADPRMKVEFEATAQRGARLVEMAE